VTRFIDGTGRHGPAAVFPFLFITIACGACRAGNSLIATGTTPKLIENERDIRFVGYGGMLMEVLRRHHGDDRRDGDPPRVYFG